MLEIHLQCLQVRMFDQNFVNESALIKPPGKGKGVPLQAWSGPEGSRKLRFPEF